MRFLALVALACVSVASVSSGSPTNVLRFFSWEEEDPETWPPTFCNKLDCPYYTVLETAKEYQVRRYNSSRWVSTSEKGVDFDKASKDEFMRLFGYISGENSRKEKIDMTAPVLQNIIPGPGPACEDDFTMSFFLAPKLSSPPVPDDDKVHLNNMREMTVYVRSFSGFAHMDDWLSQAQKLSEVLPQSAKYITEYFITAGYDSPFKLFNRHNEVWFIATN